MPIDTRFLKAAKDQVNAAARSGMSFARANPRASLGSAAAMLIAPAVFKNDNRGYLQTASITTPLIMTGTMTAPSIVGAFRSQFSKHSVPTVSSLRDKWKNAKDNKVTSFEDIAEATQKYSEGSVPLNVYQDVARKHYAGRMKRSPNLTEESNALLSHLKGEHGILNVDSVPDSTLSYLSNAIHAEKLHTLSATGLLAYQNAGGYNHISPRAPMLNKEQILSSVEENMSNEAFVRGLNSRLQRMNKIHIQTDFVQASKNITPRYTPVRWQSANSLRNLLAAQNPSLYNSVEESIGEGKIDPGELEILTLEESGHPISALRYKGPGSKGITIPIVDSNGAVRTGESFRRIGIARKVYTADNVMTSDVYAIEALKRGFSTSEVLEELQRINIFGAIDTNEEFSTFVNPEYGEYVNADSAFILRSKTDVPSHLFGFTKVDKEGHQVAVGANRLDAESAIQILTGANKRGFTKIGSESGVSKLVFEDKEVEQLAPFGLPNVEKQNPAWRSYTKSVRLTKTPDNMPGSLNTVRDSLHPFSETDYMGKVAPMVDRREIGIRVAGISGGEKTLFGDLPETVAGLAGYEQTAVNTLMKERSIDSIQARKAWMEMSNWLSNPTNLQSMRKLGTLGEGGALMRHNLYGMGVERTVRYDVHELHVPDWKYHYGTPIEEALGVEKGHKALLGYFNGNPVVAGGTSNFIENVHDMGDGLLGVEVREVVPFGTGTKFDALVKGLVSGVSDSEMRRVKEGLNLYHKAAGTGGFIPNEAEAIQVLHYAQNKTDPTQALLNITGDTFRRFEESGELEQVKPYLNELEAHGLSYKDATLKVPGTGGETLRNETFNIIERMFSDVSTRIKNGQLKGDEFMQKFASSNESSYSQWVHRYASPTTMRVWNTTQWNAPQETKVTYDMLQQLTTKGYHGAASDILSRVKYDGDPALTQQLEKYLSGDKKAIDQSWKLEEGLNLSNMGTPEGRAGTIFDPGAKVAENNFVIKLPDGTEVPVLGHKAYGGKVNRYGTGEFSASEHEKALMSFLGTYDKSKSATMSAEALGSINSKTREAYLDSLKQFVYGKNSYFRADAMDNHLALGKFIQTRASTLKYKDGSVNPFEIGIGRDLVEKIGDENIRKSLYANEDVYAAITRHPVSDMPFVRVRVDDALNHTNIIGLDEGMRGLLMADDDQDMAWAFFMRKHTKGHKEAANAVSGIDPRQKAGLAFHQSIEGIADDPRSYFTTPESTSAMNLENLFKSLKDGKGGWKTPTSLDAALRARSTSASIGPFSNTLTQMLIGLENNRNVTDLGTKRDMMRFFFTSVRQGPISAAKLKSGKSMDQSIALGINDKLQKHLGEGGKFDEFYNAMGQLADSADAGKGTAFRDYLSSNREQFKSYHSGFDKAAAAHAREVLSTPAKGAAYKAKVLGMDPNLMAYLRSAGPEVEASGFEQVGIRETENIVNRFGSATREVSEAIRGNKTKLLIGAGIAIAAGIITTSIRPTPVFGRNSGNSYNTEDGVGVSDTTPGAAREGSRASRPKRRLVNSVSQTRTAIVATLGDTADLDVRMRATDRSRTIETAKMLSRVATDGDSNITINYHNNKHTSLRSKERMKDMLDN